MRCIINYCIEPVHMKRGVQLASFEKSLSIYVIYKIKWIEKYFFLNQPTSMAGSDKKYRSKNKSFLIPYKRKYISWSKFFFLNVIYYEVV